MQTNAVTYSMHIFVVTVLLGNVVNQTINLLFLYFLSFISKQVLISKTD